MTRQPYAGKPGGLKVMVGTPYREHAATLRERALQGRLVLSDGEIAQTVNRIRRAVLREPEKAMRGRILHEMMLLLPPEVRVRITQSLREEKRQ